MLVLLRISNALSLSNLSITSFLYKNSSTKVDSLSSNLKSSSLRSLVFIERL
ncbi:ORF252 [Staphylococcus phage Twort]|uniref:ORF252 n=1 Tax=Staphylococcus phage Twort (strain DSM 17442 / HER 48) TaxID=2908167 RepID=Q4Z9A3_BPTWO|nr:ORF252 [Staphylococcus phage Twort]AAX92476.1 ORF252 [Staphylococcus phage Twort]